VIWYFPSETGSFGIGWREVLLQGVPEMSIIVWAILLVAFMWALASGSRIVRYLARGLAVVIALVAAAAAFGLMAVGHKAHWTSDGPGMLLIMLGIPICGIVAWFFGMLACTATSSLEEGNLESPARISSLAQVWERYKELTKGPH
jgi:hypothetical protein